MSENDLVMVILKTTPTLRLVGISLLSSKSLFPFNLKANCNRCNLLLCINLDILQFLCKVSLESLWSNGNIIYCHSTREILVRPYIGIVECASLYIEEDYTYYNLLIVCVE